MARMEIITRTERRRRYGEVEKAALMAETDDPGFTVAEVARRHGIAESLLYNWRANRRARASLASEPLQFISYGEVADAAAAPLTVPGVAPAPVSRARGPKGPRRARPSAPGRASGCDRDRPHDGGAPGRRQLRQ